MNYLHLLSWYYQGTGGESNARSFYKKLHDGDNNGLKFPFNCPYQVALVHCSEEEHWCVGIMVMRGTAGDDSLEQSNKLHKWYDECGANPIGTDKDCSPALLPSIEGTLQKEYGDHYTSKESFGTL